MRFHRPAAALVGVSMLALCAPAAAQEQTAVAGADAAAEEAETIVVTGSRLARDPNAIAPLPISTVGAADLQAAGNTDATATLRQIPALLSSASIADSLERGVDGGDGGIGLAVLDLRQLGAERTLVLVDGRRHVSGVPGAQIVDVSSIPNALIERVEVLTGGASAVYGADAVTGVVNYVLKKDFEGIELDAQTGISTYGDGGSVRLNGTWGKNFADGRGNVTVSAGYTRDSEVLMGDRDFTANNGRANNSTTYNNPLKRFQKGDINPATMPNFASYYTLAEGRYPYGFRIPTTSEASSLFPGGLTAAERALVDRAAAAPSFAIGRDPRFAISSGQGLLWRADFDFFGTDLNGNGAPDCDDSYVGSFAFGSGGACYVTTQGGGVKVFEDGLIATGSNQFGGDGAVERTNETSLTPASQRYFANLRGQFEFAPIAEVFWDAKYSRNETTSRNNYNTFYDSLLIFPDNPFIPSVLQSEADDGGGLRVSRDFLDLGPGITESNRDTYRLVGGVRGDISPNLKYDFAVNWGRTDATVSSSNSVLYDRLFAALDAVRAPNGQIVCRSDLDGGANPHPGSEFFPVIEGGFFTFRPGDGQCRPANILGGSASVSQEAVDFITARTTDRFRLEQFVATFAMSGDSGKYFELPGGPIAFAAGGEYRKEISRSNFDPLTLGLLPEGSPAGPAGTFIGDVSGNQSLVFDAQTRTFDAGGKFDVWEVFGEINVPILKERPFFEELSVGGAARYADYSTVGGQFTWNLNGTWAPVRDIRFRGSYAKAIRAPNISELFDPQQGATFRPSDPCDSTIIADLVAGGAANAQNRVANCTAALSALGINAATYTDPLSARFSGTTGGNPDLDPEKATTWTVGGLIQPRFVPGLTISADYYSIEIRDAIAAVTSQDIVNTCYDNSTFPNQFCDLFTRNSDPNSQTFGGLNFLRQTQINFGRLETSGIDFAVAYSFGFGDHDFAVRVNGNWTEKLDRFFDPVDSSLVNPGLKELGAPEWSGLASLSWKWKDLGLTWRSQYIGEQAIASVVQIERIDIEFGDAGMAPDYWVHDISFNFDVTRQFTVYGGVNNLTNAKPFLASSAYPVSGVGRFFFLGAKARF